ncbi:hypothetical protein COW46_01325 [Candidatus Gracilibacteria bacterium CG17_big_fil_post_rev_8_21_14_2_50_48_13]|nr:MAG: hypothetical protein COW46_01325 [Candidatus Gracilibacteria bacterium CG17_big_fil_post_rev_8_21_14_2_50_48_13]
MKKSLHWEKLEESPLTTASRHRKVLKKTYRLPNNSIGHYDVKDEGLAACVLAMTPDNEVILIQLYRPGPEKVLSELPGGGVDPGEDPMDAAGRELLEETGYTGELHFVGTSLDCAYSNMLRYNYVALSCKKIAEPAGDDDEFGQVVLMIIEEFRAHLRSGHLTDVETGYLGMDYLNML